jgi:hypothetical protein
MRSTWIVVALVLLLLAPLGASAGTIYQYVGNPYQTVLGRYTTSDSLSGVIEVTSAFASNLNNAVVTLDGWSFSDGLKTFTPANSTAELLRVTTDGSGQIVNWSFDFSGGAAVGVMGTFNNGPADQIDQATDFVEGNSLASNDGVPGSWMVVPEPSSGALLILGLIGFAARRRDTTGD